MTTMHRQTTMASCEAVDADDDCLEEDLRTDETLPTAFASRDDEVAAQGGSSWHAAAVRCYYCVAVEDTLEEEVRNLRYFPASSCREEAAGEGDEDRDDCSHSRKAVEVRCKVLDDSWEAEVLGAA
jgi:hypothetical protein